MDTRQLQHFLSVAEHGHFARAAEAIHLSQPALSRSIQQLESQLGVQLFDRGRHGATLTAFGEAALSHARAVLASTDALHQEMDGLQGLESGRLNVGTGPYPAIGLIDRVSADFVHQYPGIELTLHTGNWQELRDRLLAGELELFVADTRELTRHPSLRTRALPQQPGVLFCRPDHPLLSQLSDREAQVLKGLSEGKSNKEIARDLDLSEPTIKLHVKTLYRKINVANRTQAALVARDAGMF